MKITITGSLYSGKSCTAKEICKDLGLKLYSVGEIQRKLAEENGMSITDYNKFMDENHLDYKVDDRTREIGINEDNFIFDARLAWNFIPDSFKIYLHVNIDQAIERAMKDERGKAEHYENENEARKRIEERRSLEISRFKKIYNVNLSDKSNFDLVIDTSHLSMDEVVEKVKDEIIKKFKINK